MQHVKIARMVSWRNFCFSYTLRENTRERHCRPFVRILPCCDRTSPVSSGIHPDRWGRVQIERVPFSPARSLSCTRTSHNKKGESNKRIRTKPVLSVHFPFACPFSASFVQIPRFVVERSWASSTGRTEVPTPSELIGKKTVIAMIGLPVPFWSLDYT